MRADRHGNRLPREVVSTPSSAVLKARLDKPLNTSPSRPNCPWQRDWVTTIFKVPSNPMILCLRRVLCTLLPGKKQQVKRKWTQVSRGRLVVSKILITVRVTRH